MTWDFSTFRKASWQTVALFYSFAVFLGIAAQLIDYVPPTDLKMYFLIVVGFAVLVVYANGFMGWSVPRPIFFVITGAASLWAISEFEHNSNKFALVCLAGFIVCFALGVAFFLTERRLKAFNKPPKQKE